MKTALKYTVNRIALWLVTGVFVIVVGTPVQAQTKVRDHRPQTKVRDHRTTSETRDHRSEEGKRPASTLNASYLGNYPSDRQTGWSNGLQGVGHDEDSWFFTQKGRLLKFPVTYDLNKSVNLTNLPNGVNFVHIPASLSSQGYDHFGDLVEHRGYLFVPLEAEEGTNNKRPLLAVFQASNLAFVGSARLSAQTKAGWCAINPTDGLLYTSNNNLSSANKLLAYTIDFNALQDSRVILNQHGIKNLWDENGKIITMKRYMQGGEFSADGRFLFLINGRASSDTPARDGGIWVFEFSTGRKVLKSATSGAFKYEYHPGFPNAEEPEGLTYWDLDNKNAPKIKGKLHVILLNNDVSNDEFWLKHYSVRY